MAKPTLLLADLDGTLIAPDGLVRPNLHHLLSDLTHASGLCVPITARHLRDIAAIFHAELSITIAAGSGGAVIGDLERGEARRVVHEALLAPDDTRRCVSLLGTLIPRFGGVGFVFNGWSRQFSLDVACSERLPHRTLAMLAGGRTVTGLTDLGTVPETSVLGISVIAPIPETLATHWDEAIATVCQALRPSVRALVYPEVRLPGWRWIELISNSATKQSAAEIVRRHVSQGGRVDHHVVAVGDSRDDLGMLLAADESWCPESADPTVQSKVTGVLPCSGGDEFAEALRQVLLPDRRG